MSETSLQKGDVTTAVPWRQTMIYERREVINALIRQLSTPLFESDSVVAQDTHHIVCTNGSEADVTDTLVISGRASSSRELLMEKILANVRRFVSDAVLRIRYGVGVKDPIPNLTIIPLNDTPQIRAKKLWFRAMWAMRCGILKKIADARAMTQMQIQKSQIAAAASSAAPAGSGDGGGGAGTSSAAAAAGQQQPTRKRQSRTFAPLTQYHHSVVSNELDIHRFVNNSPTVFIFWASWDAGSVQFLQQHLFDAAKIAEQERVGHDCWLDFCSKYIDVKVPAAAATPSSSAASPSAANSPRSPAAAAVSSTAVGSSPSSSSKRRQSRHRSSAAAATRKSVSSSPSRATGRGGNSTSGSAPQGSIRRAFRLANIVLISVDVDHTDAKVAVDTLRSSCNFWMSSKVALHSMWVGEEGLHSKIATHFDITSLPVICGAHPPPEPKEALEQLKKRSSLTASAAQQQMFRAFGGGGGEAGADDPFSSGIGDGGWGEKSSSSSTAMSGGGGRSNSIIPLNYQVGPGGPGVPWAVPRIASLSEVNRYARHRKSVVVAPPSRRLDPKQWSLKQWHEVDDTERRALIRAITAVQKGSDAPVVFESRVVVEYALDGTLRPLKDEADVAAAGEASSFITLTGSASTHFMALIEKEVSHLTATVRNFDLDVMVIEDSAPMRLPLNERTAEHRVKGWAADLTCSHCHRRVVIDAEPHFHCLHCGPRESTVCEDCAKAERHEQSHVLAKIRAGAPSVIPVLWGPSNVAPLPTMHGVLVQSVTKWHVGVYCNMCQQPIKGIRWKCMNCHDYDLCATCEWSWFENVRNNKPDRRHNAEHYCMRVFCAVPGDSSAFIIPKALT